MCIYAFSDAVFRPLLHRIFATCTKYNYYGAIFPVIFHNFLNISHPNFRFTHTLWITHMSHHANHPQFIRACCKIASEKYYICKLFGRGCVCLCVYVGFGVKKFLSSFNNSICNWRQCVVKVTWCSFHFKYFYFFIKFSHPRFLSPFGFLSWCCIVWV